MIKTLNFQTDKSNWFVWSDPHVGHAKSFILNPRGFECKFDDDASLLRAVQKHDKAIYSALNERVTSNDILFLLGDTSVGMNSGDNFRKFVKSIQYKELYLMPGNHFSGYKQVFSELMDAGEKIDKFYRLPWHIETGKTVYLIPNYYEIVVNNQYLVLSHYPLASWNHASHESWMIHGHCHGNYKFSGKDMEVGKILDVGVECFAKPLNFAEVKKIMDNKLIYAPDHHLNS